MMATRFSLGQQLETAGNELAEQRELVTVLADGNRQEVEVDSSSQAVDAVAYYTWSPSSGAGYVRCENMPKLPPGQVYQLWVRADDVNYPLSAFQSYDGSCQILIDMGFLSGEPSGIGISVENAPGGTRKPADGWLLYARFPDN
jgi:hypothetical protein